MKSDFSFICRLPQEAVWRMGENLEVLLVNHNV
jgi:hypothetical protein